jgi:hypothetical protein
VFIPRWILAIAIFIEKLIEKFHKPDCLMTWADVEATQAHVKNGDVVLSYTEWELSNYFIPGPYKHAAVYFDGYVYEAVTTGVRKVIWAEWVLKKDKVAIASPCCTPLTKLEEGKKFLEEQLGEPYQYNFLDIKSSDAWFCSLYVYEFLCTAAPGFEEIFTLRKTFGEMTVTPSDFWHATDKIKQVTARG